MESHVLEDKFFPLVIKMILDPYLEIKMLYPWSIFIIIDHIKSIEIINQILEGFAKGIQARNRFVKEETLLNLG